MAEQILIRGDTLENWNRANPILGAREIALVYDKLVINAKAGDGYSPFKELEYVWYDILVNGVRIRPTENGFFDIFIPVKTSEITNDGDGTSPFVTQAILNAAVTSLQNSINALDTFFRGELTLVRSDISRVETTLQSNINAIDTFFKSELTKYPKKHVKTFNATSDWSGSSPYTITISASTHGAGSVVTADVLMLKGSVYQKTVGFPSIGFGVGVDTSGNVTIFAKARFAGRVIITG